MPHLYQPFDFTAELKHAIGEDLNEYATRLHAGGGSRLKSRLIKTLPTTLAICWYDLSRHEFTAVWAGDSRIYYFHHDIGLQQVTTDDLKSNADALENLTQDSPMARAQTQTQTQLDRAIADAQVAQLSLPGAHSCRCGRARTARDARMRDDFRGRRASYLPDAVSRDVR